MRDRIYYFTFASTSVNIDKDISGHESRNTGILATCHQTRAEAMKSYYRSTPFYAPPDVGISQSSKRLSNKDCTHVQDVRRCSDYTATSARFIEIFVDALEVRDSRIEWKKVLRVQGRISAESELAWYSLEEWEAATSCN